MKIYTGRGDRGQTTLLSGEQVPKSHLRVEAYGDVDELNAVLGALVAALDAGQAALVDELLRRQSELFSVAAWLATTPASASASRLEPFTPDKSQALEAAIDRMEQELAPLHSFILPGGCAAAAWAHVARTVCRRAERRAVRLRESSAEADRQLEALIVYLNRLSDYFFVLARYCNHLAGRADVAWNGRPDQPSPPR
ncbi:MAG: cob(I)yrinic acid a,c-diamide adenosyltransferase [Anaerolineae bacterium]|nr:cob(I)yrinic acid a,c-diamide adenosyltransferase [Anaerolineae bacterium]